MDNGTSWTLDDLSVDMGQDDGDERRKTADPEILGSLLTDADSTSPSKKGEIQWNCLEVTA